KNDYASGASANSLKTIHGGLRALQSLNVMAVIKGIRERSIFLNMAPNYVNALACILPTELTLKRSRFFIATGLFIYNTFNFIINQLQNFNKQVNHAKLLTIDQFKKQFPKIITDRITGGGLWFDAQVENTERMVLQFILSARKYQATTLNHTAATKFSDNNENGRHRLLITDQSNGDEKYINASVIVDCTSAWSFISQSIGNTETNENLTFLKSVNIVVNKKLFDTALGINIKQKKSAETRLYFFAPWRDCTIIGTWYSFAENHTEKSFTQQEAQKCLDDINAAFSKQQLSLNDICNVHIGFLPAHMPPSTNNTNIDKYLLASYQLTDWSDTLGIAHVYSLRGTKYTLARHDAKQVIDRLSNIKSWHVQPSKSDKLAIYQSCQDADNSYNLPDKIVQHLKINYGSDIHYILSLIEEMPDAIEIIPGTSDHIMAEIHHAVFNEQALSLSDLLKRRLDIGDRAPPDIKTSNYCAAIMQRLLQWTDDEAQKQKNDMYASYPDFLRPHANIDAKPGSAHQPS
ncbi:MAG: FAD-dependent oxidoreductase, partial [Gammaproteobacteria bacterium]|nr:FAD-dependent oxidoreductase [Gammaproteobacteria bacterium]